MKLKKKLGIIIAIILILFLGFWLFAKVTPEDIVEVVRESGYGVMTYILLFTLLPVVFFPVPVLALAGGILFGLGLGSLYTFIGALLNCSLMFFMSKSMGREKLQRLLRDKLSPSMYEKLMKAKSKEGFILLILLRLIPLVPYNLINYGFGLSPMGFKMYLLGSALGIIPGTLVFINVGDHALNPKSGGFLVSILLLLLLIGLGTLLAKAYKKSERNPHEK